MSSHGSRADEFTGSVGMIEASENRTWKTNVVRLLFGIAAFAAFWLTVPVAAVDRPLQLLLGAAAVGGMLVGVRAPLLGALVAAVSTGVALGCGVTADPFLLASVGVLTVAERSGSRRFPWWLLGIGIVLTLGTLVLGGDPGSTDFVDRARTLLLSALVLAAAWVLGVRTRQSRETAEARARSAERLRLARDVHDVLSHSLSAIGVQAGVVAHVRTLGEPELRAALREIETQSRDSLAELKALLHREREADAAGEPDRVAPLPPSGSLRDLVRTAERAGLSVRLDCSSDLDELPQLVRTTVHRVAQEAVTNALRHAAATELTISVATDDVMLHVTVSDNGRGAPAGFPDGHGLTGMRERVEIIGGDLRLTDTAAGFTVDARLPLSGDTGGRS